MTFVLSGWPYSQFTRALTEMERLNKIGDPDTIDLTRYLPAE